MSRLKPLTTLLMALSLVGCQAAAANLTPAEQPEATGTPVPPTPTPAPPPLLPPQRAPLRFTLYATESDSLLPPTEAEALKSAYSDPGAVVYHEGRFHMFYNVQHGYPPRETAIGYAVSPDGLTWTRVTEGSVFTAADVPYEPHVVLAGSALVEPDGTWVLYFYTRDDPSSQPTSRIGRATAPAPEGPWTVDEAPLLEPDPDGWDSVALQRPSVWRTEEGYVMVYLGVGEEAAAAAIGRATSSDGVHWTKYNDPANNAAPYAESNPIFRPEDTRWEDAKRLKYPRIRQTPDGRWWLFYRTDGNGRGSYSRIGLAVSADGIAWEPVQTEPIFQATDYPEWQIVWAYNVVMTDDLLYLVLEVMRDGVSYFKIATASGSQLGLPGTNPDAPPPSLVDERGHEMALVPAGPFLMGSADGLQDAPPHEVTLDAYYIDRFEVTNDQFAAFLNEEGSQEEGSTPWIDQASGHQRLHQTEDGVWQVDEGFGDHPVVEVTWHAARSFCAWRGGRLPTEAEWEKAARGTDGRTYPWGDAIDCRRTNYRACELAASVPVGSYPTGISPYGVHDMGGNVAEWTGDYYDPDYYTTGPSENPPGPEERMGFFIASRGGSWYSTSEYLRTYHRNHEFSRTHTLRNVGFRCARPAQP